LFQIGDFIFGLEPLRDGVRVRFEFDSQDDSGTFVAGKLEVLRHTSAVMAAVPA
jgi:hypothetical protein